MAHNCVDCVHLSDRWTQTHALRLVVSWGLQLLSKALKSHFILQPPNCMPRLD